MAKQVDRDQAADWARALPAAVEEFPFGPQAAVFKVGVTDGDRILDAAEAS